jgi:hypothetical protein
MNLTPTLLAIAENLRTQDNRITANPIFLVQKKVRTYGFDPDYDDTGEFTVWRHQDGAEADAEEAARLDALDDAGGELPEEWSRTSFQDSWETVQPFFTEDGAKEYLRINGHNVHGETRIYVESGWRNAEWETIRELLLSLGANATPQTGAPVAEQSDPGTAGPTAPGELQRDAVGVDPEGSPGAPVVDLATALKAKLRWRCIKCFAQNEWAARTCTCGRGTREEAYATKLAAQVAIAQSQPVLPDFDEDAETLALRVLVDDEGEDAAIAALDREGKGDEVAEKLLAEKDAEIARLRAALEAPRAMVLHCPACGKQHLDVLEPDGTDWSKRPHRKHLCKNTPAGPDTGCGHLWKPMETPTVGVLEVSRLPTSIGTGQRVDCSKCGHSGEVWIDPQPVIVGALQKAVAMALADEALLDEAAGQFEHHGMQRFDDIADWLDRVAARKAGQG